MVKIITDTSALYTVEEGKEMGVHVVPLCVSINGKHLRDLCFDTKEFLDEVKKGHAPASSQPPIGEVIDAYNAYDVPVLNITMAAGLSGTYQSALSAKEQADHPENVHVLNSTTLCGPQRYLVQKASHLAKTGKNVQEIIAALHESMEHLHSFLIPQDFDFLKRGGRLKPSAAKLGGLLKLKPIMEAVDGGTRLDKFSIVRTLGKAADQIASFFEEHKVNKDYKIFISHADALDDAMMIMNRLKERFQEVEFELLELSPAFITQGGPACIAVQSIKK